MAVVEDRKASVTVALLVLPHASFLTVASTLDPLRCANRHLGYEAYQWIVVSPGLTSVPLTCGLELPCRPDLSAAEGADLLQVIAGFRIDEVATRTVIRDLQQVASTVGMIAAIDSGAWILAKAGLLAGCRVTTHWEDLEEFAAAYPDLEVVADRFVMSGNRITAGGAAPAFDMIVHLIRARHGARVALEVTNSFITETVDPGKPQLTPMYDGTVIDKRLADAIDTMKAAIETPQSIAQIAARRGLSVRRLEGLFRAQLGYSPGSFYLEMRLQAARRILADTVQPMTLVAIRTGFGSASAFSRAFTRRFGESAAAYRQRCAGFSGNGSVAALSRAK